MAQAEVGEEEAGVAEEEPGSILRTPIMQTLYRSLRDKKVHIGPKLRRGAWIRVESPTQGELEELIAKHELDPVIVQDALDPYEVPRIELEDENLYVIIRLPTKTSKDALTQPLLIVLTPQLVITVSRSNLSQLDEFMNRKTNPVFTTQKTKLLLQLLQLVTIQFEQQLLQLARAISSHATDLEKIANSHIAQFVQYETQYNTYLASLTPIKMVVEKLRTNKYVLLHEADHDLLEDLWWSLDQQIQMSVFGVKQVSNIREAYSTIVSNNLNKTMKVLTSVTVILTIPTMVSSFFGMNVPVPLANHVFGFVLIAVFTTVASIGLYYIFRKKDLL